MPPLISPKPGRRFVRVVDSHTGGEPTRAVVSGGPDLGRGPMTERRERLAREFDRFRSAVVNEPRGSDVIVGALLCEPSDPSCEAGVVFFNNVGCLGMCGHGTIGLVVTLAEMGRLPGAADANGGGRAVRIETPVGVVSANHLGGGRVSVRNVPSRRLAAGVRLEVDGLGTVTGDIAWGGNWFFLTADHGRRIEPANVAELTAVSLRIRAALGRRGLRGDDGGEIDHVELFGPPSDPAAADSRNFVLCPGGAYDRSPCGTGTSAKVACLVADGKLAPGRVWRQESVVGSVFEATAETVGGAVVPTITGSAFLTAEATLILDDADPLRDGIRSA
jgi:4-hydroxyproline epimerase